MAETNEEPISLRRTLRRKKPSLKAAESLYASKLQNAGFVASVSSSDEEFTFSDNEFDDPKKPTLLHENETVRGEDLFTFQRQSQGKSLVMKVYETQKTPRAVRTKMKSRLKAVFEDSGSEYEVSMEDESSESSNSSDVIYSSGEDAAGKQEKGTKKREKINFNSVKANVSPRGRKKKPNSKYTIDTEEYFANSASSKIKTSNNTLDKLQTPRLPQYELQKLLFNNKRFSTEHAIAIKKLEKGNKNQFKKWLYVLNQNFSILLYGLGSKKSILASFQKECLQDMPTIVVNGFFPTLSIKNIVDSIIEDLLELEEKPSNLNQAVDLIIQEVKTSDSSVYLLINNIEALKTPKAQSILATLARVKNIHLIASIDHINAPLIWDHNKLSKFNFTWWDVTSFVTYQHETECEMSSMTQQSSSLVLSSLRNVFLSLTQNSKAIYLKVAKYQIENYGQYYQGMAFKDLYMACREAFIVSSDLALRAQLSEFIDHKMIKAKRSVDGMEYLIIPIPKMTLQRFMEEDI